MSISVYTPKAEQVVHYTSVDFTNRFINAPVHLVQYDNGLPIVAVSLYNNGTPYRVPSNIDKINVRVAKPDGNYVYNPALGVNANRDVVYIEITRQMVAAHGDAYPLVELMQYVTKGNENIVATGSFHVIIDPNPVRDANIESSSEYKSAKEYATTSQSYAVGGTGSRFNEDSDNSKYYSNEAKKYMQNSSASANASAVSASNAATSEANARGSASAAHDDQASAGKSAANAAESETKAKTSETKAKTSENNAAASETNARTSESNARAAETRAVTYGKLSKSYAVGGTGEREGEATDNARYYADQAKTNRDTAVSSASTATNYAKLAKSYTVGGTGERAGEDTDNARYYYDGAKASELSSSINAANARKDAEIAKTGADAVEEALRPGEKLPKFVLNFTNGELEYSGTSFVFVVNRITGNLEYELTL